MRLTRRGRLVVSVALALLIAVVGLLVSRDVQAVPPDRVVEVHRGDTLWSVARQYAPSDDPVDEVERIRRANHLSGYTIQPGDRLRVPVDS
jgi:LysM repeat protein